MLTKLIIRNFKRFDEVEIELGNPVVLMGPNNSGKTSVLQALALWDVGLRRWNEKRAGRETPEKRPGVTLNRRDLIATPVPSSSLLWRDLHVRNVRQANGKPETKNIRIEIVVEGTGVGGEWRCGFEFDYANEESIYCRPLRVVADAKERMAVPRVCADVRVAYLPPMSGLGASETRLDPGAISVRLGEGRTAEVLRNLCFRVSENAEAWQRLRSRILDLFGARLDPPTYVKERGEITMTYREAGDARLDLSASGRGLQQVLLLLAHLSDNPGSVLLLDEPDAHLEILRQRQIYQALVDAAREQKSQIIAASHSEVVLNEAAEEAVVVAFVGRPHRVDDRGRQALKSLREIGFDQYLQAEQAGWVLYLEGATDLAILRAFADSLRHPVAAVLQKPFVHYVGNHAVGARNHFYGLLEAKPDLVGVLICDRGDIALQDRPELRERMWERREIENYLCQAETLLAYAANPAETEALGPLFSSAELERRRTAMTEAIAAFAPPAALRDRSDRWWSETKASDEFLDRVFAQYYRALGLPDLLRKASYHVLARYVPPELLPPEVGGVLDEIVSTASRAHPAGA